MERNTPFEKMRMESVDLISQNVEKIAELFPECVTEAADQDGNLRRLVDFDKLHEVLSGDIAEEPERYEFTWVGKSAALAEAHAPIRKTLRPCPEESRDWDTTQNLYIEGDNLDVLKLLQESYLGRVKMIYIDPPYNTGSDSFVYPDNFRVDDEDYEALGELRDEEGNKTFKENTDTNPRFHSDWCSMIYSRLLLARNLIAKDGVIFISIDDHEVENLKKICNEVFGDSSFVATIPWRKRTSKSDVPFGVSQDFDVLLCYANKEFKASVPGKGRKYYETDDFPGQPWRIHDLTKQTTAQERPNSFFTIVNPRNGKKYPANPNATWRITIDTIDEYQKCSRIVFPGDYPFLNISKPVLRYWKEDDMKKDGDNFGRVPLSTKLPDDIGMSQTGTKEITDIMGSKVFSYPKPVSLIKLLVEASTSSDSIILDFFSGSATTAQAVIEKNKEDGGERRFILVQLQEKPSPNSVAFKEGFSNVCEIGKERIRRVADKIKVDNPLTTQDLDVGFRVLKVDSTNMNDVYYGASEVSQDLIKSTESNIKDDRTDLDLLFGCLIDWGVPLSYPYKSEEICGATVHDYNDGDLIACFAENVSQDVVEEIARRKPTRAVFRDSCFKDDASKINVAELFKRYSPDTRIKTI